MFILVAIPFGVVVGILLGGRLDRLWELRFRWAGLAVLALTIQLVLFREPAAGLVGDAAPAVYVASTAAVLVVLLRNLAIPGVAVIAIGAGCNLAAVVANGGSMPVDPALLDTIGGALPGSSNAVITSEPALRPLTDLFALPDWLPFANVFSIGDVLIAIGIALTVALAMRPRSEVVASPSAATVE